MFFADAKSQKTTDRLKALKTAKNGFELAELDLHFVAQGNSEEQSNGAFPIWEWKR